MGSIYVCKQGESVTCTSVQELNRGDISESKRGVSVTVPALAYKDKG